MLKKFALFPKFFGRKLLNIFDIIKSERKVKMKLGENILKLRKENKLSQEQLAEKVDVTRQTISNWELGETSPNPEQLKLLSKVLNISIDELLNNDIKSVIVKKVSNTEKLAGIIIKILKVVGIFFIIYVAIIIISIVMFMVPYNKKIKSSSEVAIENQTIALTCTMANKEYHYLIESDNNDNIIDASGSEYITDLLKDKEFKKGKILVEYIDTYFKDNGGTC